MGRYLFLFIPFALLSANVFIFQKTKQNIHNYAENPPFLVRDFTSSYRENEDFQIRNLVDRNPETIWQKLRPSVQDMDFELELRLDHYFDGKSYPVAVYKDLVVKGCKDSFDILELKWILREAINVDKEMRLPEDTVIQTKILDLSKEKEFRIPIYDWNSPTPLDSFSNQMNIYVIQGKWLGPLEKGEATCLSDIYLD